LAVAVSKIVIKLILVLQALAVGMSERMALVGAFYEEAKRELLTATKRSGRIPRRDSQWS
jgi:hypothetical protein